MIPHVPKPVLTCNNCKVEAWRADMMNTWAMKVRFMLCLPICQMFGECFVIGYRETTGFFFLLLSPSTTINITPSTPVPTAPFIQNHCGLYRSHTFINHQLEPCPLRLFSFVWQVLFCRCTILCMRHTILKVHHDGDLSFIVFHFFIFYELLFFFTLYFMGVPYHTFPYPFQSPSVVGVCWTK